ncbi:argininosuccinate synthase [Candidatus Saccharibacteria bacterium]|nr:argininosuccinate synthase [Candidatus Saccharibacteria bacterium]
MKNKETNYTKVSSHEARRGSFDTCLLLYSGGLDTSVILKWIQEQYTCKVITLTIDIGQEVDDLQAIEQKAKKLGAAKTITYDARAEFADLLLSEAIKANADYQGGYALSTPLGRVIISQLAVKFAKENNCQVIAHGATGKGNDQVRFESYITTLDPSLKILAPVREWSMGREEELAYAEEHGIPVSQTVDSPYSKDENMWGITSEGAEIEHPNLVPKLGKILSWCTPIGKTPDTPERINLHFEAGVPTAFNGKVASLQKIIELSNAIGAKHGVGVVNLIEDRLVGLKVRGIYENPGASILIAAHEKLEQLVSTRTENELKELMDTKWAYMVYAAQWYEPALGHVRSYINHQNEKVTGDVTVELFKGNITVVSLDSPHTLFDHKLATFNADMSFNQNASAGFIEIYTLSQKTAHGVFDYGNQ